MKIKYACRGIPKTKVRGDVCIISCKRLWALSIKSWRQGQKSNERHHLSGLSGILRTILEGGPFYPVQLVGPKCPFPAFDKILSPVPLSCILLTKTIIIRTVAWVGSVQLECTFPSGTWNFQNFTREFLLNLW